MAGKQTRVFIKLDGSVVGLYSDALDYSALGDVEIKRASEVEWQKGSWSVNIVDERLRRDGDLPLVGFTRRRDALDAEVMLLEARLRGG